MKIYTKTGDQGETGMLGGIRVSKSSIAIDVTGELDETNSLLGVVASQFNETLCNQTPTLPDERAELLEQWIDQLEADLPPLTAFILPGGSPAGSFLHQTRAVCRRAERNLVRLTATDLPWPDNGSDPGQRLSTELVYLNRLSDLLFVMARYVNHQIGFEESQWRPTRSNHPS